MRKPLLFICVFIVVVFVGLAVFILTFDVDRYRPLLVGKLESAIGKPVRLERLSLGWHGGIALGLEQLRIYTDASTQTEPLVHLDRASAVVNPLSLLKKEIQVSSVVLSRPRVHVIRDAQGSLNLAGLGAVIGAASAVGRKTAVEGMPLSFNVASLRIEEGALRLTDAASMPPVEFWVKALDLSLRNVSLSHPINVQGRMALFSDKQNLSLSCRVHMPMKDRAGLLEAVHLEADLSQLKIAELTQALPALRDIDLREGLRGNLVVAIDRLAIDPRAITELTGQIRLDGGFLALDRLRSPLNEVTVDAFAKTGRIEFERAFAKVAGGTILLTGTLDHAKSRWQATMQMQVENIMLDELLPDIGRNEARLRGKMSASFQGSSSGYTWAEIARTISGNGTIKLNDGKVENLNVLQEVFRRLSILPGLVESLKARLPQSYSAKLNARDTVLHPITLSMNVQNGAMAFDSVRVTTEAFELDGAGRLGLNGTLAIQSLLRIDPELSAAIVKSVNELQYLTDAQGRLEFPIMIEGALPRVQVMPDVRYVASRLVITKAQELLGNVLRKGLEKDTPLAGED